MAYDDGPDGGRLPADRRWRFRPRLHPATLEDERKFHLAAQSAIRIAAGLGSAWSVRVLSGPLGGLFVELDGPTGRAWFRHAVAPAYSAGQWTIEPASSSAAAVPRRFGALVGPMQLPLPFAVDRPPWMDTLLAGLAAAPGGVELEWRLVPGPIPQVPVPVPEDPSPAPDGRAPMRTPPPSQLERSSRDLVAERRHALLWTGQVTLGAPPGVMDAQVDRVASVVAAGTRLEGGNGLRFLRRLPAWRPRAPELLLSEPELVGLLPSPWARAAGGSNEGTGGGLAVGRDLSGRPVRLPLEPDQGRHLLVLGETGMGKSSTLLRMMAEATHRGAVVLLDPIGDTGRAFLGGLGPAQATRTTWVSPTEAPLGVNALGPGPPGGSDPEGRRERAVAELVMALRRVRHQQFTEGGFWGPRIEEVLGRTVSLAARLPSGTLAEAYALLGDEPLEVEVPEALRPGVASLRSFARERPEEVAGSRRVLGEVVGRPLLRRMLCERGGRFGLAEAGRPGAITVVTGEAPVVGESTARYLLAVHLALLWSELLARGEPVKVFVALEEAQWYAHEGLAELLRLGRRGNIHVWTTTQSLRSVDEPLREALLTNSADLLVFRGDPEEARDFSRWSRELTPERLLALPRGHAALLLGKGNRIEWVTTSPPPAPGSGATVRESIRVRSLERFGPTPGPPADLDGSTGSGPSRQTAPAPSRIAVLALLAVAAAGRDTPWAVSLERLRRVSGAGEAEIRAAGARLKSMGLLTGRSSGPDGALWELAARGFESLHPGPVTEEELQAARSLSGPPEGPWGGAPASTKPDYPHRES
jgi:hypothetical protein